MKAIILFFLPLAFFAQSNKYVVSVEPHQDTIGVSINTAVRVFLSIELDSLIYDDSKLFNIYGKNSGLIEGDVFVDSLSNSFSFIQKKPFFAGEIIKVSFGPIKTKSGKTINSFNWQFAAEIYNKTIAQFDSLKRFEYPSFDPIAIDFDMDGDIDIVSGTGRIIYNDGNGNFDHVEVKEELIDISYLNDINNDGILDLINKTTVSLGANNGTYTKIQKLYPFNNNGGIIKGIGDINGDGFTDLVGVEIYDEFFNLWRIFFNDGSGLNDIAGYGSEEGGFIFLQQEKRVFDQNNYNTIFSGAESFAFFTSGDINGDNRYDVVVSNYQIEIFSPEHDVFFEATVNCSGYFFYCDTISGGWFDLGLRKDVGVAVVPLVFDIDGDGDVDIIHTGYPTTVTYNRSIITDVNTAKEQLNDFQLFRNYPNPFNPTTTLSYQLPKASNVILKVYDVLGKEVIEIVNENKSAGIYNVSFNADNLPSGLYFYKIQAGEFIEVRKMLLMK